MKEKKGQVTLFIIIALVIIAIVIALLFLRKDSPIIVGPTATISPEAYLKSCIEPHIRPALADISMRGGYLEPKGAIMYQNEEIKYLCYTSDYYVPCIVQQPMIKEQVEKELFNSIKPQAISCLDDFESEFKSRGYTVAIKNKNVSLKIEPDQIKIIYNTPMTLSKDSTRTYSGMNISVNSEIYDLLILSGSVVQYESVLGDSEITDYVAFYPDLKMRKLRLGEGSKIYTLENVKTNESFRFATRSLAWPAGYPEK